MTESITLTGPTNYNPSYPPRDAKKGYIAKITGRAPGAVKYAREFLGSEATLLPGDEGLYEKQQGDKKGGYTRWYYVVLSHPEHGLIMSEDCEDELPKIAALLDKGISIADAVEVCDLRPDDRVEGRMTFTVQARTAAAAKQEMKSATIESAADHCWEALKLLPAPQQKKVMKELRNRMKPATAPAA